MKCPKCGSTEQFRIDGATEFHHQVYVDGDEGIIDMSGGEITWQPDALTHCDTCGHDGKVSDFYPVEVPDGDTVNQAG